MSTVLDAAYFRSLRPAEPEPEQSFPAPEHTSRDPWPAGFPAPRPVIQLRKLAETEGWAVRLQYSRAHTPRVDNGKPGAMSHHVVLQAFHPESRARLVAHHVTPVDGGAAKWLSVLIVSPKIPPYVGCSITDGKGFLMARGRVLPSWLDEIRARNAAKAARKPSKSAGKRRESGG